MTEIAETPAVVRETIIERLDHITQDIKMREELVDRLTQDLRDAREGLVRAQIDAENLTIWLERNDA